MKAQIASAHEGGYDFGGKCGDLLTAAAALAAAGARGRNLCHFDRHRPVAHTRHACLGIPLEACAGICGAGRNAEQAEQALTHAPNDAVANQQNRPYSTLRRDLTKLGVLQAVGPRAACLCRAPAMPFSGAPAL